MSTSESFHCPEIDSAEQLFDAAEKRAQTVRKLIANLKTARETEQDAARRFGDSLAEEEATAVEEATAERQKLEARLDALRLAYDSQGETDSLADLANAATRDILAGEELRSLFIAAAEAKAEAAEELIAPAKQGLIPRIAELLTGSKDRRADDAGAKASDYSAEGQYLRDVKAASVGFRGTANHLRNGSTHPSVGLLATIKKSLPIISDYKDLPHS